MAIYPRFCVGLSSLSVKVNAVRVADSKRTIYEQID